MNKSCLVLPEISDTWKDADVVRGENSASDDDLRPHPGAGENKDNQDSLSSGYMFLAGAAAVAATALFVVKRSG